MEELSRKQKEKHNHKWTNILKLAIFFIVMLAPFIAVLSKCLYVLNPNAKDSYTISQIISLKKIADSTSLIQNENYTIEYKENNINWRSPLYIYDDISINWSNYIPNVIDDNITGFVVYSNANIGLYNSTTDTITQFSDIWGVRITGFNFDYNSIVSEQYFNGGNSIILHVTYLDNTLDNAFYYAVEDIQNQPLFNWAKNTGIYTTIETMTTGLGMSNTIAMLLAYWSICTAVYIVFDIIIFTFTKLTHFVNE